MDATTPFTAGVYQSDVMSIFMEETPPFGIALRRGLCPVWGIRFPAAHLLKRGSRRIFRKFPQIHPLKIF